MWQLRNCHTAVLSPFSLVYFCLVKHLSLVAAVVCLGCPLYAQYSGLGFDDEEPPPFEIYALASAMGTVDATGTVVIHNPQPGQPSPFTPHGGASGMRVGFSWRKYNVALISDFGFHKYADRTGSTTLAPLMFGVRRYSQGERAAFFVEGLAGAYRWSVNSGNVNFTTVKGIVAGGVGMDLRLSRHLVWKVFELQVAIAGARSGPLLTGGPSTGIGYRFGGT